MGPPEETILPQVVRIVSGVANALQDRKYALEIVNLASSKVTETSKKLFLTKRTVNTYIF
jgi:hypothetical protein